jgi:uncharacterized protein YukE
VADELGTAVLRLELDTSGLKEGLAKAKQQVEQELGTATTGTSRTRRTTPPSSAGVTGPGGGVDERDLVRRFNLRGVVRTLETFSNEISQLESGRTLNIGSSWTKALAILQEVATDLKQVAAGERLNLNTSWTTALQTLQEVDTDLKQVAAGERLNLNTSWTAALSELLEIDTDLKQVAAGERLNLNTSWTTALQTLQEVDTDLKQVAAGEKLNLNRSWNTALRQLAEIDTDLRNIAGGKRLNLDASWNTALRQLNEIDTDLRTIASGKRLNLRASWNKFFEDAEQVRRDIRTSGEEARKRSRADTQKRTKDVAANALIGVGFPLLFGQGLGAAAGGGIGGAAGALGGGTFGFAGSIAGTAIGAQLDLFIEKSKVLGRALTSPIASFSEIQQASLLSSSGLERQIESLIAVGRSAEAAALIQQDLASRYSATTLAQVAASKKQEDEANRSFTQTTTTLGAFAAELGAKLQESFRRIFEPGFGIFNPERLLPRAGQDESTPTTATGVRIEKERSTLLSQQFKLITAQAQGYDIVALRLQKDISLGQQRLDIENLIAAKGATGDPAKQAQIEAEIQDRINKGTLERFNLDERSLKAVKDKNRENAKALSIEAATVQSLRNNRLAAIDIEAKQIRNTAVDTKESSTVTAAKLATLDIRRLAVQQDIERAAFKEFQTREQISRSIGNTLQLLGTEKGQYRDTLGTIQQISDTIDAARRKEADIGFKIDQARVGGRDEEAARLVDQQRTAALETRQRFVEGALALTKAGEQLRDNLRSAVLEFTRIRSDAQGLNRFLSPGRQNLREREDFQLLLPSFREAQGRFAQLTGTRAPEFRGSTRNVNETVRDFIATVDREFQARQTVGGAQQSLQKINEELVGVNTQLSEATNRLAAKDWNVSVNVVNNADGSRTVNAINGLTS